MVDFSERLTRGMDCFYFFVMPLWFDEKYHDWWCGHEQEDWGICSYLRVWLGWLWCDLRNGKLIYGNIRWMLCIPEWVPYTYENFTIKDDFPALHWRKKEEGCLWPHNNNLIFISYFAVFNFLSRASWQARATHHPVHELSPDYHIIAYLRSIS